MCFARDGNDMLVRCVSSDGRPGKTRKKNASIYILVIPLIHGLSFVFGPFVNIQSSIVQPAF